jgi:hypothetical protein
MTPRYLDVATRVAGGGELQRMVLSGAGVVDAASMLWSDIEALVG